VSRRDIEVITAAALCHDLGHGPYSHVFEDRVFPLIVNTVAKSDETVASLRACPSRVNSQILLHLEHGVSFSHETMSLVLANAALQAAGYDTDEVRDIERVMRGFAISPEKTWMSDIVSSTLDVDKLDYLVRDAGAIGLGILFDPMRILQFAYLVRHDDGCTRLAYHEKLFPDIARVFETRARLHEQLYQHRTVLVADAMYAHAWAEIPPDILVDVLRQVLCGEIPTDDALDVLVVASSLVSRPDAASGASGASGAPDSTLHEPHAAYAALVHRRLWPVVATRTFGSKDEIETEAELRETLRDDAIVVLYTEMHYGSKHDNPMTKVRFCDARGAPVSVDVDAYWGSPMRFFKRTALCLLRHDANPRTRELLETHVRDAGWSVRRASLYA